MKSCKVIRGGENFLGGQGLNYFTGISAESANAEAICMHLLVMPPGASAKPHYHESHETDLHAGGHHRISSRPQPRIQGPGGSRGLCLFPPASPASPTTPTDKPARAHIAWTDPNEQESMILLGS